MHAAVRHKLPGFLREHEGKYNHMYLDKKGLVSVGIGFLLETPDKAAKFDFKFRGGGPAGPQGNRTFKVGFPGLFAR